MKLTFNTLFWLGYWSILAQGFPETLHPRAVPPDACPPPTTLSDRTHPPDDLCNLHFSDFIEVTHDSVSPIKFYKSKNDLSLTVKYSGGTIKPRPGFYRSIRLQQFDFLCVYRNDIFRGGYLLDQYLLRFAIALGLANGRDSGDSSSLGRLPEGCSVSITGINTDYKTLATQVCTFIPKRNLTGYIMAPFGDVSGLRNGIPSDQFAECNLAAYSNENLISIRVDYHRTYRLLSEVSPTEIDLLLNNIQFTGEP